MLLATPTLAFVVAGVILDDDAAARPSPWPDEHAPSTSVPAITVTAQRVTTQPRS